MKRVFPSTEIGCMLVRDPILVALLGNQCRLPVLLITCKDRRGTWTYLSGPTDLSDPVFPEARAGRVRRIRVRRITFWTNHLRLQKWKGVRGQRGNLFGEEEGGRWKKWKRIRKGVGKEEVVGAQIRPPVVDGLEVEVVANQPGDEMDASRHYRRRKKKRSHQRRRRRKKRKFLLLPPLQ
jgi:hypothetical protein